MDQKRCTWAKKDPILTYYDTEHGKLIYNDNDLFERLVLEMMQTGLSFQLVLQKRVAFKSAFLNYDFDDLINASDKYIISLYDNAYIIRNKQKIQAVFHNANCLKNIIQDMSFLDYLIINLEYHKKIDDMVKQMVKKLKKDGFKFVGPSVVKSLLELHGIIRSHESCCEFDINYKSNSFVVKTPLGDLEITYDNYQIELSKLSDNSLLKPATTPFEFVITKKINYFIESKAETFNLPLKITVTYFQKMLYDVVLNTKKGDLLSYKDVVFKVNTGAYRLLVVLYEKIPYNY